tara:strand:+ start:8097 stop:8426 length:330 start_codon:yes stop_codon:yes gene_type:complete
MKPEAKASKEVQDFLKQVGFAVWSTEQGYRKERGGTRTTAGFPDLVAFGHYLILFIEVKAFGKKKNLSPAQKLFRGECWKNGGFYRTVDSAADVFDWLVELNVLERTDG